MVKPARQRSDMATATLLMLGSTVMFAFMAVVIRLAAAEMHPFEIAFFRTLFGFLFALPLLFRGGLGLLRTDKFWLYVVRCGLGIVSMLAGFWSLANLPLAQAVALSYSTPLFVTIGAVIFLHEVVRARRWSAVVIGFIGVLVIVRPGVDGFSPGTLVAVSAALFSAIVAISIKFLSRSEHPDTIVIYTTLIWVPLALVPALFFWTWPSPTGWLLVILAGFLGTVGHIFWTRALKLGDASALTSISFAQLPIVATLAWLLFGETLDRWTLIGAGVIFLSTAYITHRETVLARRTVTDAEIGSESHRSQ